MMNLKYYLRGLGVGIIVTAITMGVSGGGKKATLSNEEIKERARALGMVEESTLLVDAAADRQPSPDVEDDESPVATPAKTNAPTKEPSPVSTQEPSPSKAEESADTPTEKPTAVPTEKPTAAPTKEPEKTEEAAQGAETISIQINRGDGSLTVSRKLEEAGLVDSAADFDLYLCQNGYDKRLNVGTFEIPAGAGKEEIARILARSR